MQVFLWIIRGTPLMLQIMVVFYVPGLLFRVPALNRMVAAILAIVINYAVYFSEVFRAGYQSVDAGQREAAQVLGLLRTQTFTHVYLTQVIKKVLPPLTNETISLVKDTALARAVAVTEIILAAEKIVATHAIIYALFYTGLFYLAFNGLLSLLFNFFEKKLSYYEG